MGEVDFLLPALGVNEGGEHDGISSRECFGDGAVGVFDGEADIEGVGDVWDLIRGPRPIRVKGEHSVIEEGVGFADCFEEFVFTPEVSRSHHIVSVELGRREFSTGNVTVEDFGPGNHSGEAGGSGFVGRNYSENSGGGVFDVLLLSDGREGDGKIAADGPFGEDSIDVVDSSALGVNLVRNNMRGEDDGGSIVIREGHDPFLHVRVGGVTSSGGEGGVGERGTGLGGDLSKRSGFAFFAI